MTTSSDRILLRWVPLAAFLAVVMAVSLSVGPQPFGFHEWPKAPAARPIERVVRATPRSSAVPVAARPAQRSDRAGAGAVDRAPATSRHPFHRPAPSASARRGGERSRPEPRHARGGRSASAGPARPGSQGTPPPAPQAPDRTPLAEAPHPRPPAARAKRGPGHAELYEAAAGHRFGHRSEAAPQRGRGRGHGHGRGLGRRHG
jgi:hypothetical protein